MTLPEKYAHDYRDMAMSEEELRKMLEEFADEIRKERVNHCDDINCPECPKVAYEAGVKAERERMQKQIAGLAKSIQEHPLRMTYMGEPIVEWNDGYSAALIDMNEDVYGQNILSDNK